METQHQERFLLLIEKLSKSPSDFSRKIGKSPQTISSIIGGKNKAGADVLEATLLAYSEINPEWLLLGRGEPFRRKQEPESEITTMWQSLKESYEETIKDLRYTVSLQKQILSGDLGKLEAEEPTQREIYKLVDRDLTIFKLA